MSCGCWRGSVACAPYEYGDGLQITHPDQIHSLYEATRNSLAWSIIFDETGKSKLSIPGVKFNAAGLRLATLNTCDFEDNDQVNTVVAGLASNTLRSQASSFGSNPSIKSVRFVRRTGAGKPPFFLHANKNRRVKNSVKRKIFGAILRSREPMAVMVIEIWIFAGLPPHLVTFANHI
jgi:hypothetical protein